MSEPEFQNTMPTSGEFWVMSEKKGMVFMSYRYYWYSSNPNGQKYLCYQGCPIDEEDYPKEGLFITGILHKE